MKLVSLGRALGACTVLTAALLAQTAIAVTVKVQVFDQDGHALSDAAVYAVPLNGKLPTPHPGEAVIDQVKRTFVPLVTVIQTGTSVSFPNKDNIEHDVYSFSPAKTFELDLYSGVPSHPVVFDKPGLAVLGCNIHDSMIAYVYVVDSPYFGKSDQNGIARVENLPPGNYEFRAWHYQMADTTTLPSARLSTDADADVKVTVQTKPK
ncbi:Methylamine utilization protein [Pararobbsia alpina]|uniref:methylamine utilization protein n=1 Tax=Pararobbsia alpina TaxID=621374 RepID=UPI0039A5F4EB